MKVIVTCDVDEEMIKKVSGCDDSKEAVESEFGWLTESGINPMRFDFDSEKREFAVRIEETLAMVVYVEAADKTEAEQIVSDRWRDGDYLLDYGNFVDVDFKVIG